MKSTLAVTHYTIHQMQKRKYAIKVVREEHSSIMYTVCTILLQGNCFHFCKHDQFGHVILLISKQTM